MSGHIPFDQIARVSLTQAGSLLAEWFPNGRVVGREFMVGNIAGDPGESLRINLSNGKWADFATGMGGPDLIGVRAAMKHNSDRIAAARELGLMLGIKMNGYDTSAASGSGKKRDKTADDWQPIVPPPAGAPKPAKREFEGFSQVYDYLNAAGDCALFYVRRREARNGEGKQFIPLTYGELNGQRGWHAKAPGAPRPLYGLDRLAAAPDATVIIAEGEKAALASQHLFPDYVCVTWAGGAKAVEHADLKPLRDRQIIIWPDNDVHGHRAASALRDALPQARILQVTDLPESHDAADVGPLEYPEAWLAQRLVEAEAHEQHSTDAPQPGRILTGAEFIARHVPPVWLIDGIVQRSRLYACTSITGHGKTAVWLFNACMIHAGRMIGQLDVFQGNVLILAGENPADLEARMIGMAKAYKLPLDRLPYVLPGSFPMTEDEAVALKRDIAGLGVPLALIVGDTASSFFPGDDENSNVQAGGYARTLRRFNECAGTPAVMALCHPIKNPTRGNLLPRGGGAFLNELDGNLALWSHALGEVTELHWCGKIRGPDFSALGYRLRRVPTGLTDEKDRDEMTIICEPMSDEAVADHTQQAMANDDVVLRALHNQPGMSMAQIARNAGWLDDDDQPERWRVQRAITSLVDDKLIEKIRKGAPWRLTEKGEKVLNKDNQ